MYAPIFCGSTKPLWWQFFAARACFRMAPAKASMISKEAGDSERNLARLCAAAGACGHWSPDPECLRNRQCVISWRESDDHALRLFEISAHCKKVRVLLANFLPRTNIKNSVTSAGEHKTPAFLAKNPLGKVPVLQDEDLVLSESGAILWYLG